MSLDCRLLIMSSPSSLGATKFQPALAAHEIPVELHVTASHSLVDAMNDEAFKRHPVPKAYRLDGHYITGESDEPSISTDSYGKPLEYCYPSAFAHIALPEEEHPLNKAALAYVLALPDDWPIILYWT